jgi:FixJ family two-component response regulator
MRIALSRLLTAQGHHVETFATANEFLFVAMNTKADCLLLDFHLPDMSGLELATQLRVIGNRLPVIFMTGSGDDRIRRQCFDFGCIGFLTKPIWESELSAALCAVGLARKHSSIPGQELCEPAPAR